MSTKEKTATHRITGEKVKVYKSSLRSTWISSHDFKTEYKVQDLIFD